MYYEHSCFINVLGEAVVPLGAANSPIVIWSQVIIGWVVWELLQKCGSYYLAARLILEFSFYGG